MKCLALLALAASFLTAGAASGTVANAPKRWPFALLDTGGDMEFANFCVRELKDGK